MAEEIKKIEVTTSKQFRVNLLDISKGLIISAIASALLFIYPIISAGRWLTTAEWQIVLKTGVASGLGYIIKNFFSAPRTFVKTEPPEAAAEIVEKIT